MNNDIKSFISQDCKGISYIENNVFTFYMECLFTKNGKRHRFTFESERKLDIKNCTTYDNSYTITKNELEEF